MYNRGNMIVQTRVSLCSGEGVDPSICGIANQSHSSDLSLPLFLFYAAFLLTSHWEPKASNQNCPANPSLRPRADVPDLRHDGDDVAIYGDRDHDDDYPHVRTGAAHSAIGDAAVAAVVDAYPDPASSSSNPTK